MQVIITTDTWYICMYAVHVVDIKFGILGWEKIGAWTFSMVNNLEVNSCMLYAFNCVYKI